MPTYYGENVHVFISSDKPTEKELKRLTINQLLLLAKKKKGLKQVLINFLKGDKNG